MGVLIGGEIFEGSTIDEDLNLHDAITRAWPRLVAWINSLIPQSAIRNPQSAAVFIDQPFVRGHRFEREVSRVAIVCGNCAGKDDRPRRTLLIRDSLTQAGRCADCGGRSYVLASRCYPGNPVRGSAFEVRD